MPKGGTPIDLPEGTDRPGSDIASVAVPATRLIATPNPARGATTLRWTPSSQPATAVLSDVSGRELRRWLLPEGAGELVIEMEGMPSGRYTVAMSAGSAFSVVQLTRVE